MFFRRQKPRTLSFSDHLDNLKKAGFAVENAASGQVKASKAGCAALLQDGGEQPPAITEAGVAVGKEIGALVHGGFQTWFQTPTGKKIAAQAAHLRALHAFQEELREALGLTSLYNEGLGTVCDRHLYDRVQNRDHGVPARPWEQH